jgi:methyl-accepting chemotaxis protein
LEARKEGKPMLKGMRLNVKLIGGFILVAFITLMVGLLGWYGISDTLKDKERQIFIDKIAKEILAREIDHLKWTDKAGDFKGNQNLEEVAVQKDDQKCKFGQWFSSKERKRAEKEIPEIAPLLQQIEEPH